MWERAVPDPDTRGLVGTAVGCEARLPWWEDDQGYVPSCSELRGVRGRPRLRFHGE